MKVRLPPQARTGKPHIDERVAAQVSATINALIQKALKLANGGEMPNLADVKEHAKLFDNQRTGQMQLWWLGETVLLLTPGAEGLHWQFMGSAAAAMPQLRMVETPPAKGHPDADPWDKDADSQPDPWKRAFPGP